MTALQGVPARKIVRAIAGAAERWSDADFPPRVRASDRIVERTGYSLSVVDYALDRLFFGVTESELCAAIRGELGSLEILDGFRAREGRPDAWARPAGSVCVISSRTTIGVAAVPAIFALCAKCDVLVKDREDSLLAAFFETLAEELDEFTTAARAASWQSGDGDAPDIGDFDAVVVFGSEDTIAAVARSARRSVRCIGFGSRASAGYVTRESLNGDGAESIAEGAARDLVLYESEGCLSLHVLFVERGGTLSPEEFCARLAAAVERANVEFPVGVRDPERFARIAQERDLAAFRSASGSGAVFSSAQAEYAVLFDPPGSQAPHFLPRTIGVIPVDDPQDALAYLREQRIPLEAFALSSARPDAVRMAVDAGAARLTRFGQLQHPPVCGDHGGRPRIAEFVRWVDKSL